MQILHSVKENPKILNSAPYKYRPADFCFINKLRAGFSEVKI